MKKTKRQTYVGEVLSVLLYEFPTDDYAEATRKIKRRLRDKKLGEYDPSRIDLIRAFKDDVQKEIEKGSRSGSRFQSAFHEKRQGGYADIRDWNYRLLLQHMKKKHPHIPKAEINDFLGWAVGVYYLR